MTVMYKRMEKKMQSDIDALKGEVETQEAEVAALNQRISELKDEKETINE